MFPLPRLVRGKRTGQPGGLGTARGRWRGWDGRGVELGIVLALGVALALSATPADQQAPGSDPRSHRAVRPERSGRLVQSEVAGSSGTKWPARPEGSGALVRGEVAGAGDVDGGPAGRAGPAAAAPCGRRRGSRAAAGSWPRPAGRPRGSRRSLAVADGQAADVGGAVAVRFMVARARRCRWRRKAGGLRAPPLAGTNLSRNVARASVS